MCRMRLSHFSLHFCLSNNCPTTLLSKNSFNGFLHLLKAREWMKLGTKLPDNFTIVKVCNVPRTSHCTFASHTCVPLPFFAPPCNNSFNGFEFFSGTSTKDITNRPSLMILIKLKHGITLFHFSLLICMWYMCLQTFTCHLRIRVLTVLHILRAQSSWSMEWDPCTSHCTFAYQTCVLLPFSPPTSNKSYNGFAFFANKTPLTILLKLKCGMRLSNLAHIGISTLCAH